MRILHTEAQKGIIFAIRGAELIVSAAMTSITFVGRTLGHAIIGASKKIVGHYTKILYWTTGNYEHYGK